MAVGAISASRQPPPSPTPTPKTEITPIQPKPLQTTQLPKTTNPPPKKSCVVVIKSTNLRHPSERKKTGQVIKAGTKVTLTGNKKVAG
jgi:serine/threonine-protein kinase